MLVIKEMQGCAKDDFPDFISLIKTKRTARFLKAAAFFKLFVLIYFFN